MLSNAYFLAKFRFDTAENEPAKNLQNFASRFPRSGLRDPGGRRAAGVARCAGFPVEVARARPLLSLF